MINNQISIILKNNTEAEQATKSMLERILNQYNLTKYIQCTDIFIEQGTSGKAFPLIRLSAWQPGKENSLLAQFIHEQLHWIEKDKKGQMIQAVEELKLIFPDAPIDKPEGGGNEKSTYSHLIICRLELLALSDILSKEKAIDMVSGNTNYTWIRKMVIERAWEIDPVIKKYFPEALGS